MDSVGFHAYVDAQAHKFVSALFIEPGSATIGAGMSQQFTATLFSTVVDLNGAGDETQSELHPPDVVWSLDPLNQGVIFPDGLYQAPNTIVTLTKVTVTATITRGDAKPNSATATVTLTPDAVVLTVSPTSDSLRAGESRQFKATLTDNGTATALHPPDVTWSPPQSGRITNDGLYTAPSSISATQTVTIKATSSVFSAASASVSVTLEADPIPYPISFTTRSLSYRFYTHFHPYVFELIKQLNAGSVARLQAADTDYKCNADGSLQVLPDTTRATFKGVPLRLTDNTEVAIPGVTPVTLLDGSQMTVAEATSAAPRTPVKAKLSGSIPAKFSSGIQMTSNAIDFILPEGTQVTLPQGGRAFHSDGTLETLPANAVVLLRSGLPRPTLYDIIFSTKHYDPSPLVEQPYPVKDLDFTTSGAYSIYNWELFFHVPLLIAVHLSENQRFSDAQKWFHYIFDPTDDSAGPTPERFWKVKPFQTTDVALIENILLNLSTGDDPQLQQDTINSIAAWKDNPFQPFVVGAYRPTAFMLRTVMAYLDNLIAWGDSLFRQYTIETINEATQLYILAANILGPRPQAVPKKPAVGPRTYSDLRARLNEFSTALKELEVDIPFDLAPHPVPLHNDRGATTLTSIAHSPYFCVPRNDKLLGYWDTVADRLFKIHNSLNLQGVFQQLPLYEPRIDPALLVRAAAAGVDVSAIVNGLNQPLPLVRFQLLVAKAAEIAQEVKSLGASLLAAMEKRDNEAMALLRAQHERIILGLAEMVKYSQWQEAIKAREGLEQSLTNAINRYAYYQEQLGKQDSETQSSLPALDAFDKIGLENASFRSSEPQLPLQPVDVDIAQDAASVSDGEVNTLSRHEVEELDKLSLGRVAQVSASLLETLGSGLALIPQFGVRAEPGGVGVTASFGGQQLHSMTSGLAAYARAIAEELAYEANRTARLGNYARREQDWINQSNQIIGEINLIFKQLRGAQIREALAEREYKNHQKQIQQAQEIEDFLQDKQTDQGFYTWLKRETKALYNRSFQLAFEVAKKAERALQQELGDPSRSYIQFTYLDGIEGLLAGEKLLFDVKRMEMAYHDLNEREYELTKHVSLLQLAPFALLQLRATGSCEFSLSEELFDFDGPGQYFRRIKTVAVTIPCVTGPYTGVSCTLTLLNSSIRTSPAPDPHYPRSGPEDQRFSDYYGTVQSIVTSSGQADSGLFETNLRDERYLPFELSGVMGNWRLELPANPSKGDPRQFDYDTIADVVLHMRYTARQGGKRLKDDAVANLTTRIEDAQSVGSVRLFSVRHEFPSEWAQFKGVQLGGQVPVAKLLLPILEEHFPFWSKGRLGVVKQVNILTRTGEKSGQKTAEEVEIITKKPDGTTTKNTLQNLTDIAIPQPPNKFTLKFTFDFKDNSMEDLWLALAWGK